MAALRGISANQPMSAIIGENARRSLGRDWAKMWCRDDDVSYRWTEPALHERLNVEFI